MVTGGTYISYENHICRQRGQFPHVGVVDGRFNCFIVDVIRQSKLQQHERWLGTNCPTADCQKAFEGIDRRAVCHFLRPVSGFGGDRLQVAFKVVKEPGSSRRSKTGRGGGPEPKLPRNLGAAPLVDRSRNRRVAEGIGNQSDSLFRDLMGGIVGAVFNNKKDIHQVVADAIVF